MRKILCTVLKRPKSIMEGETISLTLEKSDVTIEADNLFVARTRLGRDATEVVLEAMDSDPAYGDKTLKLASKVIVCWLPVAEGADGTAQIWTS